AVFTSKFHILNTYDWNDTMEMTVIGLSDNGNSTNSSLTRTIPVQFAVDLVAKALPQDSITYINFTLENKLPKTLVNVYEVQNLGFKSVPVTVAFTFPTKLEHKFEMKDYQISVLQNHTQCGKVINSTTEYCSPEKYCKSIECESFLLEKFSTVTFVLSGNVAFKDLEQHARSMPLPKKYTGDRETVNFSSFVKLSYDKKRYIQTASETEDKGDSTSFHQTQIDVQAEIIIPPHRQLIIGTGVGVGIFLLIIVTVAIWDASREKRLLIMKGNRVSKMTLLSLTTSVLTYQRSSHSLRESLRVEQWSQNLSLTTVRQKTMASQLAVRRRGGGQRDRRLVIEREGDGRKRGKVFKGPHHVLGQGGPWQGDVHLVMVVRVTECHIALLRLTLHLINLLLHFLALLSCRSRSSGDLVLITGTQDIAS
ncbi:unnamed protein product, partial [Coregonus sp. 'balchen']